MFIMEYIPSNFVVYDNNSPGIENTRLFVTILHYQQQRLEFKFKWSQIRVSPCCCQMLNDEQKNLIQYQQGNTLYTYFLSEMNLSVITQAKIETSEYTVKASPIPRHKM